MRLTGRHTLDVYNAELWFATTPAEWAAIRRRFPEIEAEPEAAGLSQLVVVDKVGAPSVQHVLLWLDVSKHAQRLDLIDTVAHEATHAASQILDHIGHTPTAVDEPHAYLVGWLVRWMLGRCCADDI